MYLEQALIAIGLCIQARIPVLIWGAPGVGKSSAISSLAKFFSLPIEVVIASIREPADFAGLPIIDQNTSTTRLASPHWAKRLVDLGKGILFLDEITTAPPAVQKALLRVVLEKVVGELVLPDEVSIVAAANPPELASDGYDLTPPMANRFVHLDWPNDPQKWVTGMRHGWNNPCLPTLPTDWENYIKPVTNIVTGFIDKLPDMLYQFPKDPVQVGRAWPSNRSWDVAIKTMAVCQSAQVSDEITDYLLTGCVGQGAAIAFSNYLKELRLPDPEALLSNPNSLVLPLNRHDAVQAILMSVVGTVIKDMTPERYTKALRVLCKAASQGVVDIAWPALCILQSKKPSGANTAIPEMSVFQDLMALVA